MGRGGHARRAMTTCRPGRRAAGGGLLPRYSPGLLLLLLVIVPSTAAPPACRQLMYVAGNRDYPHVEGLYLLEAGLLAQRPVYRHACHDVFLYYHLDHAAWWAGPALGAPSGYALSYTTDLTPGGRGAPWRYWSQPEGRWFYDGGARVVCLDISCQRFTMSGSHLPAFTEGEFHLTDVIVYDRPVYENELSGVYLYHGRLSRDCHVWMVGAHVGRDDAHMYAPSDVRDPLGVSTNWTLNDVETRGGRRTGDSRNDVNVAMTCLEYYKYHVNITEINTTPNVSTTVTSVNTSHATLQTYTETSTSSTTTSDEAHTLSTLHTPKTEETHIDNTTLQAHNTTSETHIVTSERGTIPEVTKEVTMPGGVPTQELMTTESRDNPVSSSYSSEQLRTSHVPDPGAHVKTTGSALDPSITTETIAVDKTTQPSIDTQTMLQYTRQEGVSSYTEDSARGTTEPVTGPSRLGEDTTLESRAKSTYATSSTTTSGKVQVTQPGFIRVTRKDTSGVGDVTRNDVTQPPDRDDVTIVGDKIATTLKTGVQNVTSPHKMVTSTGEMEDTLVTEKRHLTTTESQVKTTSGLSNYTSISTSRYMNSTPVVNIYNASVSTTSSQPEMPSEMGNTTVSPRTTVSALPEQCGRVVTRNVAISFLISGRNSPFQGKWPWMAAILTKDNKTKCGAAVVSSRYLATAAHCIDGSEEILLTYRVVLGANDRDVVEPGVVTRSIRRALLNANYSYSRRPFSITHDVGLIELDQPIIFSDKIQPVCLPESADTSLPFQGVRTNFSTCYITGFGYHSADGSGRLTTSGGVLQEQSVRLEPISSCARVFYASYYHWLSTSDNICVRPDSYAKLCQGDSGSPMMCREGSRWTLVGVASWSIAACISGSYPSIYVDLRQHADWIRQSIISQSATTTQAP